MAPILLAHTAFLSSGVCVALYILLLGDLIATRFPIRANWVTTLVMQVRSSDCCVDCGLKSNVFGLFFFGSLALAVHPHPPPLPAAGVLAMALTNIAATELVCGLGLGGQAAGARGGPGGVSAERLGVVVNRQLHGAGCGWREATDKERSGPDVVWDGEGAMVNCSASQPTNSTCVPQVRCVGG